MIRDDGERLIVDGNESTLTYGEHLSRYLSASDLVDGMVVLDIASGTGYGSYLMAAKAKTVTGLDNSPDAVSYAKEKYKKKNLDFALGDAHNLEHISTASIDVVVSFETIEHLSDPQKFIGEVKRVLKKDGIFIASTPNSEEFMEGNKFHVHEFRLAELQKLLKKNFSHNRLYYQGTWFTSGIFEETDFKSRFLAKSISVSKTMQEPVGKAVFFVVISSDASLKNLTTNVVLADIWSTREDQARDKARLEELAGLNHRNDELTKTNDYLNKQLEYIKNTRWWRFRAKAGKIKNNQKRKSA
jgi:ubiquinone/menaquinone biosynthesis C-methylase UbiE